MLWGKEGERFGDMRAGCVMGGGRYHATAIRKLQRQYFT